MADYPVRIEAISINGGKGACKGRARTRLGEEHLLHIHTPAGICARALHTLYPYIMALRFSEKTFFERKGPFIEIYCPDGDVLFRLSRVREESKPKGGEKPDAV